MNFPALQKLFIPVSDSLQDTAESIKDDKVYQCITNQNEAYKREVQAVFDEKEKKVGEALRLCKEKIKEDIPKDEEGIRKWHKHVFPNIKKVVEGTKSFAKGLFEGITAFLEIVRSVIEAAKEIVLFYAEIKSGIKNIFS